MQHAPGALGELFKFVSDGRVKVEITKYPLADASIVHTLFEERKTTGKLVFLPWARPSIAAITGTRILAIFSTIWTPLS